MSDPIADWRSTLARRIDQGIGRSTADVVVKNGRVFDLVTGDMRQADVAICGDTIVAVGDDLAGTDVVDARGKVIVPGFIDTHLHVESSLVTPDEFDRCVLPHGVTTAICDPHEIANVLGAEGIAYFLDWSRATVMDLKVNLSSCVPATDLETAAARLDAADLLPFAHHENVIGLAEFMNFPGVLAKDAGCIEKLAMFAGRHIDGHAPLVTGRALDAYCAAGIRTDHEATSAAEAREKLSKGMTILVREGSVSKDLHALCPIISPTTDAFLAFCTDDRNPLDIAEEGHIDFLVRSAIAGGAPVLSAYRMASISAARAFGLRDRGLVAPGWRADLVLLDDVESCAVSRVISAGRLVTDACFAHRGRVAPVGLNSVKLDQVAAADFRIPARGSVSSVIGVDAGRILTRHLRMELPENGGARLCDLTQDAVKVAVVARHGVNRNIGRGFVHGFGLQRGAIASSVGHDSHNICVVGASDEDMAIAVNRLIALEGGFVVAAGGAVRAELALPVAGLMSLRPFEDVRAALQPLRAAARTLGVTLPEPFLQVAFLPLPVIPHLKITDKGLVDVDRFQLIEA